MRILFVGFVATVLLISNAIAGGPQNSNNSTTAVAGAIATGGVSTAIASGSDNTFINIPGGNPGALSNTWQCSQSKGIGLGPLAFNWTYDNSFCIAEKKMQLACANQEHPIFHRVCEKFVAEIVAGKYDEDYEPPVVYSAADTDTTE